jgi:hypothetical protein
MGLDLAPWVRLANMDPTQGTHMDGRDRGVSGLSRHVRVGRPSVADSALVDTRRPNSGPKPGRKLAIHVDQHRPRIRWREPRPPSTVYERRVRQWPSEGPKVPVRDRHEVDGHWLTTDRCDRAIRRSSRSIAACQPSILAQMRLRVLSALGCRFATPMASNAHQQAPSDIAAHSPTVAKQSNRVHIRLL